MQHWRLTVLLLIAWGQTVAHAGVERIEIENRKPVLNGKVFGRSGAYEMLSGRIYFSFDPANPMNQRIVDLHLAPRNADGKVEAWANFVVLKPVEPAKSSGVALVEVSNRGGKFSMRYFNRASRRSLDADAPESFGDGLLMRQGVTVIWVGWQFDVPKREGALRLHVPRARHVDGSPIYGLVRSDWTIDRPQRSLLLSHRNHIPYPVADPRDPVNTLTVRDGRDAPRRIIPRDRWRFAREEDGRLVPDSTHIYLEGGFQAGKIYELVYRSKNPAVVGLGLAAIRDIISYAKYDSACPFPVKYGIAAGVSQTGRFLRHFLYQGFNTDEQGRQAYDGLMIITAGAGRGSFNHRFAQPSRDAHRYSAFFYPTDIFPFTSRTQFDSLTWRSDGLMAHQHREEHWPKTFFINTGYEYWGRAASLIHTSVDGAQDVEPLPRERIYHLASGQHFVGRFPPRAKIADPNVYRGNPLDFSVNYRALLVRLIEWVKDEKTPPPSRYPRITDGTLVPIEKVRFPKIPGVVFPKVVHVAYRVDYGPRWFEGIIVKQPPRLGPPYPSQVSQVDSLGNEVAGIRNVELRVPLATYTPWNLRLGYLAATHELTDFLGTFIPFPRTRAEKQRWRDPRPSLDALYRSKMDYLQKIHEAAQELVNEGFLLPEDVEAVADRLAHVWDWMHQQNWP